jgi:hypothetical protein
VTGRAAGRRNRFVGIAALATVVATAACSTGDTHGAAESDSTAPVVTAPGTSVPLTAPSTVAPTTATNTTMPLSTLVERFVSVEVSARVVRAGVDRVVSIAATESELASVPDPDDPLAAAAWCSGVAGLSTDPFVVRVSGDAVGAVDGGIEGFELVSDDEVVVGSPDAGMPADPVPASLTIDLDDGEIVAPDAVLTLGAEPNTGTFRAETADGTLVEGAFRCR